MDRRQFLTTVGTTALGMSLLGRNLTAQAAGISSDRRPNIILIVSDDQGYADAGCYDHGEVSTPGIDLLAREGVRFTDGYVTAPVCSPSRAGFLTGRYQQRFGYYTNASSDPGLPPEEITIAELLKDAGYATGMIGKWHLGHESKYQPVQHGFDEFYGFLGGSHDYFKLQKKQRMPILRGTKPINETGYLTQNFTREAVTFIEHHKDRPFFLYLTYNAVHTPLQAPEEYLKRFTSEDETRNTYLAMLSCMDDGITEVLKKLDEAGISENTLVFFMSDNGGTPRANGANNGILRGRKGQLWEGGIRVPFIVRWPAQIPAGKTCPVPCISLDILPTSLAAAGIELPKDRVIDGKNMLPLLQRESRELHDTLFWAYNQTPEETWAIRQDNWKLSYIRRELTLCDLSTDPGEQKNLAKKEPELVNKLTDAYNAWRNQMGEPTAAELEQRKRPGNRRPEQRNRRKRR